MVIIELPIPEELDKAISAISLNKQKFIIDTLKEKLREAKIETLKSDLIEGYRNSHEENKRLLEDYKHTDLEHWDEY